jgi:hypothetical protein
MANTKTTTENVEALTGELTNGLEKGQMANGEILRITQGLATDVMTVEQIEKRQVKEDDPFVEIEVGIPELGVLLTKNMKDYTRINGGGIPAASTLGKIMAICEVKVGGSIPLMTREVDGRDGKFVVWEIAI